MAEEPIPAPAPTESPINISYDQPTVPTTREAPGAYDNDDSTGWTDSSIPEGTLPGAEYTYEQPMEEYYGDQATQPGMAPGTEQTSIDIEAAPEEFIDPELSNIDDIEDTTATTGTAVTTTDPDLTDLLDISDSTYAAFEAEAAQGEVKPEMLLRHQLEKYMQDIDDDNAPWADAAIREANALMAKRGMGASSMAGAAISTAMLEAAVPLAQFDATTFTTVELQNLRNRHETLLSNASSENAARQFNAQSKTEIDKFAAELRDRVFRFNAEQLNAMETFNTDQTNSVKMFYDKMSNETDKFQTQNELAIAQSNAEWRRSLNMANTAADNAAMQQNVQNRFNVSQTALNNLWQQSRDVFHWANTSAENARDRAFQVILNTTARNEFMQDLELADEKALSEGLGNLAFGLIGKLGSGWIDSWFKK